MARASPLQQRLGRTSFPHLPQFSGSLSLSTQAEPQHDVDPMQPGPPPHSQTKVCGLHTLPRSHAGLQAVCWHMPVTHCCEALHGMLQPPQRSWLVLRSKQPPPLKLLAAGQQVSLPLQPRGGSVPRQLQLPSRQVSLALHALPHIPQFMASLSRFLHTCPQQVCAGPHVAVPHLQTPATQVSLA
jgi:hypothetical protein